jgi:hypothetical protein
MVVILKMAKVGQVRVGRSTYKYGRVILPTWPGFTQIVSLTYPNTTYGDLSPYHLKNERGQLLENTYQFSRVFPNVPAVSIPYSSKNKKIVWEWPAEQHVRDRKLTPEYFNWRKTGMNNPEPVRCPVGWAHRKECLFSLEFDKPPNSKTNPRLDYIQARQKIYLPQYLAAVKKHEKFVDLKQRLANGENLLIIEIDGPHQESLNYYIDAYDVDEKFIENDSMLATDANLKIMLLDPKHPFGHGYCLAMALM